MSFRLRDARVVVREPFQRFMIWPTEGECERNRFRAQEPGTHHGYVVRGLNHETDLEVVLQEALSDDLIQKLMVGFGAEVVAVRRPKAGR